MALLTVTVLRALSPDSELYVSVRRKGGLDPDPAEYWRFCYPFGSRSDYPELCPKVSQFLFTKIW